MYDTEHKANLPQAEIKVHAIFNKEVMYLKAHKA